MGGQAYLRGYYNMDSKNNADFLLNIYKDEYRKIVEDKKLPFSNFSLGRPFNLLTVLDAGYIYYTLFHNNASPGMTVNDVEDLSDKGNLDDDFIAGLAAKIFGYRKPYSFCLSKELLNMKEDEATEKIKLIAMSNFEQEYKILSRPDAIRGFELVQPFLDKFYCDNPNYENNVFIMMRIRKFEPYLTIEKIIREHLSSYRLKGLIADDKIYPTDDDLWNNVCVYMMGCKYGIAIFNELENEPLHNVALEYGFMLACNKRVLILKEKSSKVGASDIIGKLFKPFDADCLEKSIKEQLDIWLKDIGLAR